MKAKILNNMIDNINKKIDYKSKLLDLGNFTTTSIYTKILLEGNESILFDWIIYFDGVNNEFVSLSLLQLYTSFAKSTIQKLKYNLIKIGFISVKRETKKGCIYDILWKNIYEIVKSINDENNAVKKLILSDQYRISKGLNTKYQKDIETFLNSPFDVDYTKNVKRDKNNDNEHSKSNTVKPIFKKNNTITAINEDERYKQKLFFNLNRIQENINNSTTEGNNDITNSLYNELNLWKNNARAKKIIINYNQNTKLWN